MIKENTEIKCPVCDSRHTSYYDGTFTCLDCNLVGDMERIGMAVGFKDPQNFVDNAEELLELPSEEISVCALFSNKSKGQLTELPSEEISVCALFSNKSKGQLTSDVIDEVHRNGFRYDVFVTDMDGNIDDAQNYIFNEYGANIYNYQLYLCSQDDIDAVNKALENYGLRYLGYVQGVNISFVFYKN